MLNIRELTLGAILLRLALAVVMGGVIGLDRGMKNRPAGLRTYMLVCLGSAAVMMTNQYVYQVYGIGDPVRMGAQVISGIGFLGAGTIIVTQRNQIKGLTTAAGLWASACMGLALGIGLYEVAICSSLLIFAILTILHRLDNRMRQRGKYLEVYVELHAGIKISSFLDQARERSLQASNLLLQFESGSETEQSSFSLTLKGAANETHDDIMRKLRKMDCIAYVEEL